MDEVDHIHPETWIDGSHNWPVKSMATLFRRDGLYTRGGVISTLHIP